jgi:hypothetical protein
MAITDWTIDTTDHVTIALERLPYQFNGQTTMEAFVTAVAEEIQALDDAIMAAVGETELSVAAGDTLDDVYGALVNEDRGGASDAYYRALVKVKVAVYQSTGTPEELIAILLGCLPEGVEVRYHEAYDDDVSEASVIVMSYVTSGSPTAGMRARIVRFLELAMPGGKYLHLTEAAPGFFGFSGVATTTLGFGQGRFGRGIQ